MVELIIVDDDPAIVRLLKRVAKRAGYGTRAVPNGEELFEALESSTPDLILLDLNMPRLDGVEVLKELARKEIRVPVMLVSGSGAETLESAALMARVLGLDVRGVVRKPVDIARMERLLAESHPSTR